jgi:hypothetical protein
VTIVEPVYTPEILARHAIHPRNDETSRRLVKPSGPFCKWQLLQVSMLMQR